MSTTLSWILGEGGLLGSHLNQALSRALPHEKRFSPSSPFRWDDPTAVQRQIREETMAFHDRFEAERCDEWTVYWAAGTGIIGSNEKALRAETETLRTVLQSLQDSGFTKVRGAFFLASSAGALSPECRGTPTTEETPPEPISEYGVQKLEQEDIVATWAREHPNVSVLIGRISNLYGTGQSLRKGQGLLSHMSWSSLQRKPINIYVSFDTIRDYICAPDAAELIVACMVALREKHSAGCVRKLIVSEAPVTIGEIIGTFRRIATRPPLTVQSVTALTAKQRHHVYFRSTVMRDARTRLPIGLAEGMATLHENHRRQLAAGLLP